jgi:hypothetical protein
VIFIAAFLYAALSGTRLRQAEAANDLARSYGEFGQGDAVQTIDPILACCSRGSERKLRPYRPRW